MEHICSMISVMEVFFQEPTRLHFIREIGRNIYLAQTSTRNYIKDLEKQKLIMKKSSKPFDGYIANRENDKFIYLKRIYNMYSLYELKEKITQECHPKAFILFGSYLRGEDVETSDIDLMVISKVKKEIDLSALEKTLKRKIHLTFIKDLSELDEHLRKNIKNGFVLQGEI